MVTKRVLPGGKVRFRGLVYQTDDLLPMVGLDVLIGRDRSIDDADVTVSLLDGLYFTNASNKRKWAEMTAGLKGD